MKLYTYYRSSAAYRVRIALHYKNLPFESIYINLLQAGQFDQNYQKLNPQARVPTLIDGDLSIGQSMAILEYLHEQYPDHSFLPETARERAWVRYLANIIACDTHPLNNSGTIKYLTDTLHQDSTAVSAWYRHWVDTSFHALEKLLAPHSNGQFCHGNSLSVADICLIPQIYNAYRFDVDMQPYPTLMSINQHCLSLDCVQKALPENQGDCPSPHKK